MAATRSRTILTYPLFPAADVFSHLHRWCYMVGVEIGPEIKYFEGPRMVSLEPQRKSSFDSCVIKSESYICRTKEPQP